MTPAVRLEGVAVERGGQLVWSEGTFDIPSGSLVGVIGPNGSGKTTLLELILGVLQPAQGTLQVLGEPPRRGNPRIGYVPQGYTAAVGNAVRARDLVALGVDGHRIGLGDRRGRRTATDRALERLGVRELAERRLSELSGGQQQRVAIAQALVADPELLLLDEPFAHLDLASQHDLIEQVAELSRQSGITTLIVAHDLNPLLGVLTGAVYLLDGHPHYGEISDVVDEELLSHLYGTAIRVVRTPQGDLFTRSL